MAKSYGVYFFVVMLACVFLMSPTNVNSSQKENLFNGLNIESELISLELSLKKTAGQNERELQETLNNLFLHSKALESSGSLRNKIRTLVESQPASNTSAEIYWVLAKMAREEFQSKEADDYYLKVLKFCSNDNWPRRVDALYQRAELAFNRKENELCLLLFAEFLENALPYVNKAFVATESKVSATLVNYAVLEILPKIYHELNLSGTPILDRLPVFQSIKKKYANAYVLMLRQEPGSRRVGDIEFVGEGILDILTVLQEDDPDLDILNKCIERTVVLSWDSAAFTKCIRLASMKLFEEGNYSGSRRLIEALLNNETSRNRIEQSLSEEPYRYYQLHYEHALSMLYTGSIPDAQSLFQSIYGNAVDSDIRVESAIRLAEIQGMNDPQAGLALLNQVESEVSLYENHVQLYFGLTKARLLSKSGRSEDAKSLYASILYKTKEVDRDGEKFRMGAENGLKMVAIDALGI